MAKTDWQMGDTVLPDDLNQIGQEINQNRDNLAAHTAATTGVHGATSAATPNTIVQRDAQGRIKAAAPSAADDVARKAEVDTVQTNLYTHKSATTLDHPDGSVTTSKLADGAVTSGKLAAGAATDTVIGTRTINDASAPNSDTGSPTNLWSWLAYMIKAITGKSNWRTPPATTLEAAANHINTTTGVHGATSAATPNTIVQRDAEGNIRTKNRVYFSNDDFIEFDDSTDTFSFFDDSNASGGAQDSNIRAGRIRLTATSDASETSTNHAFQIGPDNGQNIRVDTNEIIFVNNGVFEQGYIHGSRVDLANSVRGNDGGNAQAKMGNTWYDIWHKGNLLESEITHQIATNTYKESDSITAWPMGLSYMRVEWAGSDANLWLENVGSVLTLRCTTQTGFQFFIPTVNNDLFYTRTTVNGVWQPWRVVGDYCGNGSPEGNVTARVGSIYRRLDGSSGSTIYVKRSGSGNTGWYALA